MVLWALPIMFGGAILGRSNEKANQLTAFMKMEDDLNESNTSH